MWFGTKDGLNRYDGYDFTIYGYNPSDPNTLSSNLIACLFEGNNGRLWVGTMGGLNCFDRATERFKRFVHDAGNPDSLINNQINAIYEDSEGVLWVGTAAGLDRLEAHTGQFIHYRNDPKNKNSLSNNTVTSILEERSGALWIGTQKGFNRFDKKKGQFDRISQVPDIPGRSGAGDEFFISISPDIHIIDKGKNQIYHHDALTALTNDIFTDRGGVKWFRTDGYGIYTWSPTTNKFFLFKHDPNDSHSLGFVQVRAIFEDRDGNIWISGYSGLDKFDKKTGQFRHIKLKSDIVWSFHEDLENPGRILWLGSDNGALIKFDRLTEKNIKTYYLNSAASKGYPGGARAQTIFEAEPGVLWVGTGNGLIRMDKAREEFALYGHDPENPGSLGEGRVQVICRDGRGDMWIGTSSGGINRFDKKTGTFTRFRHKDDDPDSLSYNDVMSIHEDRSGVLWIGTAGGGLNKMMDREKGLFKCYMLSHGLPNNVVYGILEDGRGCLWLSTNNGISRFDPGKETFRNYDESDGLQSKEFNTNAYFKSRSGEMFFGGLNGFNVFHPENVEDNPYLPEVAIVGFQIFNKEVPIGRGADGRIILSKSITETEEIMLSYRDNVFSFNFSALNYASPEKNKYARMMEGFEKEWSYIGNRRFANYMNMPPGRYVFRVKAANNDGLWNERGVALRIRITPPFWKTRWFYLLCAAMAGLAVFSVYGYRVSQLKKRERQLSQLVKERTSDLNKALKQVEQANQELGKANAELEQLSLTDSLTQLPNRRNFEIIFAQEWKRCGRESQPLVLLMIDIDFFKLYNDTYGHLKGDECLKQVAAATHRCVFRAGDFVARLGGEEFVVVLPNTSAQGACLIAERARTSIEELGIPHRSSRVSSTVTISIGMATGIPDRDKGSDRLIAAADHAMYQAKEEGRNRVVTAVGIIDIE